VESIKSQLISDVQFILILQNVSIEHWIFLFRQPLISFSCLNFGDCVTSYQSDLVRWLKIVASTNSCWHWLNCKSWQWPTSKRVTRSYSSHLIGGCSETSSSIYSRYWLNGIKVIKLITSNSSLWNQPWNMEFKAHHTSFLVWPCY